MTGKSTLHPVRCRQLLIFVSLAFLLAGASVARADELHDFLAKIEKQAATIGSFTCKFTQVKRLAIFSQPVVFQGQLVMQRPDKLRWEFTAPMPSALIMDGRKGVKCSANSKPVEFDLDGDPIMSLVTRQLWSWMDGKYLAMDQIYDIELAGPQAIILVPKQAAMAEVIKRLIISFSSENLQPSRVRILESGGDSTDITFHDYDFALPPPADLFTNCDAKINMSGSSRKP